MPFSSKLQPKNLHCMKKCDGFFNDLNSPVMCFLQHGSNTGPNSPHSFLGVESCGRNPLSLRSAVNSSLTVAIKATSYRDPNKEEKEQMKTTKNGFRERNYDIVVSMRNE